MAERSTIEGFFRLERRTEGWAGCFAMEYFQPVLIPRQPRPQNACVGLSMRGGLFLRRFCSLGVEPPGWIAK